MNPLGGFVLWDQPCVSGALWFWGLWFWGLWFWGPVELGLCFEVTFVGSDLWEGKPKAGRVQVFSGKEASYVVAVRCCSPASSRVEGVDAC